jgi:hypothetical protein
MLRHTTFWDYPLGPVFGAAGTVTTISVTPQCRYRVEKVMATDTSPNPGFGVGVVQFMVGQQLQRPVTAGASLATFFGPTAIGNGLRWGVCDKGLSITLQVSFIASCTFHGSLFGSGQV